MQAKLNTTDNSIVFSHMNGGANNYNLGSWTLKTLLYIFEDYNNQEFEIFIYSPFFNYL